MEALNAVLSTNMWRYLKFDILPSDCNASCADQCHAKCVAVASLNLPALEPVEYCGDRACKQDRRDIGTEGSMLDPVIPEGPFMPGGHRWLEIDTSRIVSIGEVSVHEIHDGALNTDI